MADLSLIFPSPRPVDAGGVVWEVEQLRLRDLARLESILADPDPLAGMRGGAALALAACNGNCLEPTGEGEAARSLLRSVAARLGIWPAGPDWSPTLGSREARNRLLAPEGRAGFLWIVLGRGRPDFGADAAVEVLSRISFEEWQAVRSAAYGIDPIEEWADWVCPEPGGKSPRTWCEAVVSALGEYPDPSKLEAIGNLYIGQWRIIASGGKWRPGEARGEREDVREINRRKRMVLMEPGRNGDGDRKTRR